MTREIGSEFFIKGLPVMVASWNYIISFYSLTNINKYDWNVPVQVPRVLVILSLNKTVFILKIYAEPLEPLLQFFATAA